MEISRDSGQQWHLLHGSLDFWLAVAGLAIAVLALPIVALAWALAGILAQAGWVLLLGALACGWLLFRLLTLHAEQGVIVRVCLDRRQRVLIVRTRRLLAAVERQAIPLAEVATVEARSRVLRYQALTLNPLHRENIEFRWHNSNPLVAIAAFFTGQLRLYQLVAVTTEGREIPLTCYETDFFSSKQQLAAKLTALARRGGRSQRGKP